ncbi:MAG: hypothetical protein JW754_01535 [Candidatus Aenigmarchaeota archaeon]|nr:hypothetical protein [Candidatus Aenigmarchaeota archaeon]
MIVLTKSQWFSIVLFLITLYEVIFGFTMNMTGSTYFQINQLQIWTMFLVVITLVLAFYFWNKESRLY